MQTESPVDALQAWTAVLGEAHVHSDAAFLSRYTQNVSAFERTVPAVLEPGTTEEVADVVRIAAQHQQPLYAISTGKNWGFGSRLPVTAGATMVDLRRMNRIREVSVEGLYAVVEAGVTQRQLYDYLREHNLPLVVNVTGSGAGTSLIGNSLERGIGYFSSRAHALSGLEVVQGDGSILRTGFGHYPQSKITHLYPHGVGPSLDGLFAQSGMGIVTAAGFELMPSPEAHKSVVMKIEEEGQLAAFVDALADLRRRDLFTNVVHIGNRNRTVITLAPLIADYLAARRGGSPGDLREEAERIIAAEGFGPWSAVVGLTGTPGHIRETIRCIKRTMRGLAEVQVLSDRLLRTVGRIAKVLERFGIAEGKLALFNALGPLYGLSKGVPTDAPVRSVYWPVGDTWPAEDPDPDHSRSGMLYCLPFFPMNGAVAREVADLSVDIFDRYGFVPYTTLNIVDARAFEGVINLAFDRESAEQTGAAKEAVDELQGELIRRGYLPYRVGIENMADMVDASDPYWEKVRQVSRVFDPHNILSPGRYNLE